MPSAATSLAESPNDVVWQHPSRNVRIEMRRMPLASIPRQALMALQAEPRLEVGGLLLGKIVADAVETRIIITAAEFVPSAGPRYNSAPGDARNLTDAVSRHGRGEAVPVGYFRSHLRDGLSLSEEDARFMQRHLRDPKSACLLVQPFEMGVCMAAFFLWENGRLETHTDFEVPMFSPEDSRANTYSAYAVRERGDTAPAVEPNRALAVQTPPEPLVRGNAAQTHSVPAPMTRAGTTANVWKPVALIAVALGTAAATWVGVTHLRSTVPAAPVAAVQTSVGLGLQVDRHADGPLEVKWDRNSVANAGSGSAELTIADGSQIRALTLDLPQLREGKVEYFPTASDITFELTMNLDQSRSITESIRVVLPSASAAPVTVSTRRAPSPAKSVPVNRQQAPPVQNKTQDPLRVAAPPQINPEHTPDQLVAQVVSPGPAAPKFPPTQQPAPQAHTRTVPIHIEAPAAAVLPPSGPDVSKFVAPAPAASKFVPTAPASPRPGAEAGTATPGYSLPRPTRKVMPDSHLLPMSLLTSSRKVEVVVRIDEKGRITAARAVNVTGLVASAATAAAKQWKFEPATVHGKAIPADFSILFDFQTRH